MMWSQKQIIGQLMLIMGITLLIGACQATTVQIIPTTQPTVTATFTFTPTATIDTVSTPTPQPPRLAIVATAGPSPTSLFGATRTPVPADAVPPTRIFNPNAPRIEFFTADELAIEPGETLTLFWSVRNTDAAVIYRVDAAGERTQVFNVAPDGSLEITTRSSDRGQLNFLIGAGEDALYTEIPLTIPLQCPITWFFSPSPEECPDAELAEVTLTAQSFERGLMIFIQEQDIIYVLFNDGSTPAWRTFDNNYDPAIHPERDPNAPPQFIQPLAELGFIWRGNETVRNRLGLGQAEAVTYLGALQTASEGSSRATIYLSSPDATILQLIPGGDLWQIIAPV
ncbi:MAG: hypothetical protein ACPG7F_16270 [Aggregatilineales bacterium]